MTLDQISIASLTLAMAAVWTPVSRLWLAPFVLFVGAGLLGGWLEPIALVSMTACATTLHLHHAADGTAWRAPATALLVVTALALGLHLAPGYGTVRLFTDTGPPGRSGWDGVAFTADKPLAGLLLLLAYRDRLCSRLGDLRRAFAVSALPIAFGVGAVYAAAIALGQVVVDPVPLGPSSIPLVLVLLARTLFFTVVAEEMLFRQVIQSGLERRLSGRQATPLAVLGASTLFGLAHFPGGWAFVLLATLAGAVYGYAFARSGRIETAIAAHLVLNAGQALLLSTPDR